MCSVYVELLNAIADFTAVTFDKAILDVRNQVYKIYELMETKAWHKDSQEQSPAYSGLTSTI